MEERESTRRMRAPSGGMVSTGGRAERREQDELASLRRRSGQGRGTSRAAAEEEEKIGDGGTVLLIVQTLLCGVVLLLLFAAKLSNGPFYGQCRQEIGNILNTSDTLGLEDHIRELRQKGLSGFVQGIEETLGRIRMPADTLHKEELEPTVREPEDQKTDGVLEGLTGQGGYLRVEVYGFASSEGETRLQAPAFASFSPAVLSHEMVMPVQGSVTSGYGYREHPITDELDFHDGVDIAAPMGAPVGACLPGVVSEIGEDEIYGNYIVLAHNNVKTKYGHCSEIVAPLGASVRQGETIARVGSTGVSTGPHVHLTISIDGVVVNPVWILDNLRQSEEEKT